MNVQRRKEILNTFVLAAFDVVLVFLSMALTYLICLRDHDLAGGVIRYRFVHMSVVTAASLVCMFFLFGVYKVIWNSVRTGSIMRLMLSVSVTAVISYVVDVMVFQSINEVVFYFMLFFFLILTTLGFRMLPQIAEAVNLFLTRPKVAEDATRTLIVGGGQAAEYFLADSVKNKNNQYSFVGIVDDNTNNMHKTIHGIKIIGTINDIAKIVAEHKVECVIIAIPSADNNTIQHILSKCPSNVKIKIMPSVSELRDSQDVKKIREIKIEDILGRDPQELDISAISSQLKDKVVMVTGGGGSIGSELCRQIASYQPSKLVILDFYENNAYDIQQELLLNDDYRKSGMIEVVICSVQEKDKLDIAFKKYKPYVVFHAAAYKHVPLMEAYPHQAIKNNIIGTYNAVKCSIENDVSKFVMISTDKAVNPTNIMGATKRAAELIVQAFNGVGETEFVSVRFGNVLGSNGSVVPLFKRQIMNGGPVTVTDRRITRFFMTIPEASSLVLNAFSFANGGEIFILDMGDSIKIIDLAENMIKLAGLEVGKDIEIKETGLRPGEKLYEEIMLEEEGIAESSHQKIFKAKTQKISVEEAEKAVEEFKHLLETNGDVVSKLKEFVPTYHKAVYSSPEISVGMKK